MALMPNEIRWGYLLILGREPSREEIARMRKRVPDINSMRHTMLNSREFLARPEVASAIRSLTVPPPAALGSLLPLESGRLVFLHVPKCGGTTLHHLLEAWYGKSQMHDERFNGLYRREAADLASKSVFSGHFDFYSTCLIPGPLVRISFLRDPLERLVSLYNFHRAHSEKAVRESRLKLLQWAHEFDIDEYFMHPEVRAHHAIHNSIVRHFSNIPQVGLQLNRPELVAVSIEEMFQQACRNLEEFAFIGFMDRYEADLAALADVLGMPRPGEVAHRQVLDDLMETDPSMRKVAKQKPSEATMAAMTDLVTFDRDFYAYARSRFPA